LVLTSSEVQTGVQASNPPLAFRMAVIAFLNQNIAVACIWGSFSVLLGAVELRLGVGRELSTLAVPIVNLATAVFAPITGALAAKYSLRLIMLSGSLLSLLGFLVLAFTASYPLYLLAYGLLLGPGMAAGAILPATLVTRWYGVGRGRVLGIVCAPVVIAIVPLVSTWVLLAHGLPSAYGVLAALATVSVIANLFIVDRPPSSDQASTADNRQGAGTVSMARDTGMAQLLRSPLLWVLTLGYISSITGSILITANMVPMARSWGFSATLAATLLAIQSFAGIGGTVLFGWVADRLGGKRALAILLIDAALLWLLLLLHPPFAPTAVIVGLIGVHGAGAIPVLGVALSEVFGRDSFSRAYGLVNLINLPFAVLSVPAAAVIFAHTGSYARVVLCQAAFLAVGCLLVLSVRTGRGSTQPG
jgi:MFS family permease